MFYLFSLTHHPPPVGEWRSTAALASVAMVSETSERERRRNNSPGKLRDLGEKGSSSDKLCTLSARHWKTERLLNQKLFMRSVRGTTQKR
jgi:hypothetical protein